MDVLIHFYSLSFQNGLGSWLFPAMSVCPHLARLTRMPIGFEVLTAAVMKRTIFWDIMPCSPLSVNRRFGGTCSLRLQGKENKLSKKRVQETLFLRF
jgi:hypothetical protein